MRVMLTSCGLETEKLKAAFLTMLGKNAAAARALFIPTAAIDPDAVAVLPKCMNDLLKCEIPKEIITVFDLHRNMPLAELEAYDVVYLCGGRTSYLLERINETGFRESLLSYIGKGGFVIGVSAGSVIFADNLPGNLGLLDTKLAVHCDAGDLPGRLSFPLCQDLRLSNTAALLIRQIPDDAELIDD